MKKKATTPVKKTAVYKIGVRCSVHGPTLWLLFVEPTGELIVEHCGCLLGPTSVQRPRTSVPETP